MGTHQPQNELFSYRVNLEQRVRADHPLRRLQAVLDLSFVRPEVEGFYGVNGHVGTDPVILVKMMLLLFLDDVPSERELVGIIRERLDYLWFLGYGLDDEVPNHSVLSKARSRWGSEVFCRLFVRTVHQCVAAGLVDGKKLHIDSSLVRADAARDSVVKASPELVAALRTAYTKQEQKLEEGGAEAAKTCYVSSTDPEASLSRGGGGSATQLGYKHHRTVDNAQGVITAVATTTGQAGDAAQLSPLIQQHESHTAQKVATAVGDKHYGSAENYRYCQQRGITSHLGVVQAHVKGKYPVSDFVYEPESDRYRCPAGHYLYYHNFKKDDRLIEYKIQEAGQCAGCALRAQCTSSRSGRTVTRAIFSELVEAGRRQAQSPAARRDLARRKHLMEGSFADAANNHGFKRARWRGLWRQQIQDWLIAAIQNLRILVRKGWKFAAEGQATVLFGFRQLVCTLRIVLWDLSHKNSPCEIRTLQTPSP